MWIRADEEAPGKTGNYKVIRRWRMQAVGNGDSKFHQTYFQDICRYHAEDNRWYTIKFGNGIKSVEWWWRD